jgi:hypothetical protein
MSEPITHDEVERLAEWLRARAAYHAYKGITGIAPDKYVERYEEAAAALRYLWARAEQESARLDELERWGRIAENPPLTRAYVVAGHMEWSLRETLDALIQNRARKEGGRRRKRWPMDATNE